MNPNELHLDSAENAYFEKETTFVKAKAYDVVHKDLKALLLLPVSTDVDPGADTIEWHSYDSIGVAKIIHDYATDFTDVEVSGEAHTCKVYSIGKSYKYSIQDIRRSNMANKRLDYRKAVACRRTVDEKQEIIAWKGGEGLQGLFDYPGINEYVPAVGATGASKLWSTKTADEKLADIAGLISVSPNVSNGKEIPDTLILPLSLYMDLSTTPYGSDKNFTLLSWIQKNYPWITKIDWVTDLKDAGASGTTRVMAYNRDPMKIELQIPSPFNQVGPMQDGMIFRTYCEQRTGGVIVYYVASVTFMDGL